MKHHVDQTACRDYSVSSKLEWILPNGRGGFAMGTVSGANTRRYHGHLVAAVKPPTVRYVLLANVEAYVTIDGQSHGLSTNQYVGTVHPTGYALLEGFSAGASAEWDFRVQEHQIVKRLVMHQGVDACTIEYQNLSAHHIQLALRPLVCHKFYHDNFRVTDFYPQFLVFPEGRTVLAHQDIKLVIEHPDADRTPTTGWYYRFEHSREQERGLDPLCDLYCPCELRYTLGPGQKAVLVAATEEGVAPQLAQEEKWASDSTTRELLAHSATRHLVTFGPRKSIIAGFPWFTDWGRDTMIALPGACLCTGNGELAKEILRSYAAYLRNGLIPNRFPDQGVEPEYNTADATLWFANACYETLQLEWDAEFAAEAWSWLEEVLEWHLRGTSFGIKSDPEDGLLRQGTPGIQLTWMDAKIDDWVVTPRHGKPIEVNALWINLLRIVEWLGGRLDHTTEAGALAKRAEAAFREKFWKPALGHYLDTVEPDDGSFRPNQLIAMSLPFPAASGPNAKAALAKVRAELLTPNGVRTLGPSEPGYTGRFFGSMRERDAAYHQGTVWPWLLGSYAVACVRNGEVDEARAALSGARQWMETCGIGGIAEVYDGDAPQMPGGCPWQAWSVAEVLRAWDVLESAQG